MRRWQVQFQVYRPLPAFPFPGELVEEQQDTPGYRLEGRLRKNTPGGQLACTLAGVGGFSLRGQEYRLPPGQAFLANHTDPDHAYYYPPEGKEPWIFLWISLLGKPAEAMIRDLNERCGYVFTLPLEHGLIKRLHAWRAHRNTVQALSPPAGARLAVDVLADLGEVPAGEWVENAGSALANRAQQYILEHLEEPCPVGEVAAAMTVSREHLTRIFRDQLGQGPAEYIRRRKLRLAGHLLRETGLGSGEIAARLGFDNATTFIRAFKRHTGMTPQTFRRLGLPPPE